jgi:cytochrome c oxidase accessory protein FixG
MLGFSHSREWIYPQSIRGYYQRIRRVTFLALHAILFLAPWITVSGHPLLRVDLPTRRTYLFGQIFTASDTLILVLVLFFAAFSLFFFTSLWGRLWCGYACPQTVFLESWIRPIELWIEGDRSQRRWRDKQELSFDRAWRKAVKWSLFLGVAFLLAMAMMSVFAGARELWTGQAGPVEYGLVGFFTLVWFWDFTWFREQFCNYLCPYARFQSALTDDETLQIQYYPDRGEPRGGGRQAAQDGRCIDCNKCVVVCPQGIDIRDGFQLECIGCARCVDACVSVMDKLGHETLVAYGSIAEADGRTVRRLRPRTVVYGGLLTTIAAAMVVLVLGRVPFEASVNRAPGTLFTIDGDGFVRNTYLLNITNNAPDEGSASYEVSVEGLEDAEVLTPEVELASEESRTLPLIVRVPASDGLERTIPVRVRIETEGSELLLGTTFKTGADVGRASP